MEIGFTGTRRGMTGAQQVAVVEILRLAKPEALHHGACVGADEQAAEFACKAGAAVIAHPGKFANAQADDKLVSQDALYFSDVVLEEKTHFARNRDIVDACDELIATPWQTERPERGTGGGTWYTVEYAEKRGKTVVIVWPDGSVSCDDQ